RLDDDVATQVRHLAAVVAGPAVSVLERLVERQAVAVDGLDRALLREPGLAAFAGPQRDPRVDALPAAGRRHDDPVADAPSADGLGQAHRAVAGLRGRPQLQPG